MPVTLGQSLDSCGRICTEDGQHGYRQEAKAVFGVVMEYRIGIDAGSKTIKVVTLDASGKPVHTVYRRHRSNIKETTEEILHDLIWRYGDIEGTVAITGSAGIELAKTLGLPFVQEVIATTKAVQSYIPEADAIIELGGEDAKVVYLSGGMEQRMNATCAGGTGGFIDTIAFMLGVGAKEMSGLAMGANRIYPIASRCAVFAQTDVRPLLNSGAKKSDIAGSALEAVVRQTIGGLACGRPIVGNVVFLGGPLEHIPDLVYRFRRALGLTHKTGIKPSDAHLFTAMGAAILSPSLCAQQGCPPSTSLSKLEQSIGTAPEVERDIPTLEPLFISDLERAEFKERHAGRKVARKRLSDCQGALYLGIDAGSTTVKMALVDCEKNLVYSDYQPTKGDTLQTATRMLEELYRFIPREYGGKPIAYIAHATATGYGEDLLRAAFDVDSGTVETIAHLHAAQSLYPKTDFILDIGGQDMKALWVRNGTVVNAILNEACSSGCGSFIEGTAYSLKLNPYTFADLALQARSPVDLGMKCTVFMTSRVRHAQKAGVPYADIAAGLAYSVVKNALFKIIGMQNLDELGDTVVVQGGAFMSDAVLRAFELVSGKQVIRPDIAHLMGAFGAALIALRRGDGSPSNLIAPDSLRSLEARKRVKRCTGCTNACMLTLTEFENGRMLVSGNRCSRALGIYGSPGERRRTEAIGSMPPPLSNGKGRREGRPPDLYSLEQKLLSRYQPRRSPKGPEGPRGKFYIGIPQVLNLYESLPFWHTFFSEMGFSVVISPGKGHSTAADAILDTTHMEQKHARLPIPIPSISGLETVPSESVCYPAKTSHLRIAELLGSDVDAIFMPRYIRGARCPVSSTYARVLAENASAFRKGDIRFISPTFRSIDPMKLTLNESDIEQLFDALAAFAVSSEPVSLDEVREALLKAREEQLRFERHLGKATGKALSWLDRPGKRGVVLAGRPYHVDPDISHMINGILTEFGFAVLSPTGIDAFLQMQETTGGINGYDCPERSDTHSQHSWKAAKTLERMARFAIGHPRLEFVCLNSFGCGFDALNVASVRPILERQGKTCTSLKIDDIIDLAHIRIRLRTMAETLEGQQACIENEPGSPDTESGGATLPPCAREESQGRTAYLGLLTQSDIESARSYVSHDVCFVVSAMAGRAIALLKADPSIDRLVIPEVCKSCLLSAMPDLIDQVLGQHPDIIWEDRWLPSPMRERQPDGSEKPHIGVIGNAFLCFDEHANRSIVGLIEELGCTAVLPEPEVLFTDDVRYLDIIEGYLKRGIRDIIYVQAFGCLKGHTDSRGSLRRIQRLFPQVRITVIDYDNDTSALNQENRIRLAVSAAFEPIRIPANMDST